ncbi:hypothetical protein VVATL9824_02632 [Vibrio vulnificus]|nr:hypothetical protein VVATL9824_02632 [Vibrio vulnificus]
MPRGIFGMRRVFGGESGLREVGLCGIHPLTRRYASNLEYRIFFICPS